ncbi:hypothetical protein bcere0007_30000 [Bacillus mycoides]|uniref:hypothetical protein n=1 Tax=Bacillus mycoides TaxID=1405 RepID=UPI0001A03D34|nr:hypothetical protein [Bacillus mycoides]EEK72597.1 hypothetical protein bcere0007_30000 [Bacillus mycoides]
MDQQNLNKLLQLHQCKKYHSEQLHDIENQIKSLVMEMQLQSYEQEIREIMKQYLIQAIEVLECIGNPENDLIKSTYFYKSKKKNGEKIPLMKIYF